MGGFSVSSIGLSRKDLEAIRGVRGTARERGERTGESGRRYGVKARVLPFARKKSDLAIDAVVG